MSSPEEFLKFTLETLNTKQIKNLVRHHNLAERIMLSKMKKDDLINMLIHFYTGFSKDGKQLLGKQHNLDYLYDINPIKPRQKKAITTKPKKVKQQKISSEFEELLKKPIINNIVIPPILKTKEPNLTPIQPKKIKKTKTK